MEEQEQGQELEEGEEKKFGSRCSRWRLLWLLPACFCLLPPALVQFSNLPLLIPLRMRSLFSSIVVCFSFLSGQEWEIWSLSLSRLSLYLSVFYCECIFEDLLLLFFKAFVFPPAFLETLFFCMFVCVLIVCDLLVLRQGLLLLLLVLLVMLFCNPHAVVASRPWHQVLRGGEGFRRGRGRKRGELGVHHRDVVVAVPIAWVLQEPVPESLPMWALSFLL